MDKVPQYADYFRHYSSNFAVPALFMQSFPGWFVGLAFAAIAIGALVPAAIMSIAKRRIACHPDIGQPHRAAAPR